MSSGMSVGVTAVVCAVAALEADGRVLGAHDGDTGAAGCDHVRGGERCRVCGQGVEEGARGSESVA